MDSNQYILLEINDHVAELTLNRPDELNSFKGTMHDEFIDALLQLRKSTEVRVLILSATGKAFSAGGDIDEFELLHDDAYKRAQAVDYARRTINALIDLQVPIVVAMHGDAVGLGATLVLAGDITVANKTARIGDPHVRMGLVAGDGGCLYWPAALGINQAKRFLLTGDLITGEEAHRIGLVTDIAENSEAVKNTAREIAQKIANLPPLAVQGTKKSLDLLLKARAVEVFEASLSQEAITLASDDVLEAVAAFKEKRKPEYKNR